MEDFFPLDPAVGQEEEEDGDLDALTFGIASASGGWLRVGGERLLTEVLGAHAWDQPSLQHSSLLEQERQLFVRDLSCACALLTRLAAPGVHGKTSNFPTALSASNRDRGSAEQDPTSVLPTSSKLSWLWQPIEPSGTSACSPPSRWPTTSTLVPFVIATCNRP